LNEPCYDARSTVAETKKPGDELGFFSLCAAMLSHQPRAKSNVSFRQQSQSDILKNVSSWRAERTQNIARGMFRASSNS